MNSTKEHSTGTDQALTTLLQYVDKFNLDDIDGMLCHWKLSAHIVTDYGLQIFNNEQERRDWWRAFAKQLRDDGWMQTEVIDSTVTHLNKVTVMVNWRYQRKFSDGREEPMGAATYILINEDSAWVISSAIFHTSE